jgi:acyl-homoserine lactone acylase PvdQ
MERIKAWDRRAAVDSVAYTYIHYWGKAYQDMYGRSFRRFLAYSRKDIDLDSLEEQKMALAALEKALAAIEKRFSKREVPWGDINVVIRGGTFSMDGEPLYGVLHPDEGIEREDGRIECNDGWGHLMIVMEGEPKQIWTLLPYGQSEHPGSRHYNDQARLHSRRQVKPFRLTPAEIGAHTESVWGNPDRIKRWVKLE